MYLIRICLAVTAVALLASDSQSALAQSNYVVQEVASPSPLQGIKKMYVNDEGSFFLASSSGSASFEFEGKGYWSKLKFVKSAGLRAEGFVDQGLIYKDKDDPFYVFFSQLSFSHNGQVRYRLYFSFDGTNFTRWLTNSGTRRFELDSESVTDFQGLTGGGGGAGGGPGTGGTGTAGPDGKKTKYPITASGSVDGGDASVTVLPEGIIKIEINGKHSGPIGRTKYSCVVVLSGYRNGEEYIILNRPDTENLTVGANFATQIARKNKTFTQDNAFAAEDRYNIRNVRVFFVKDKSNSTVLKTVKNILQGAGEIFDETESLYKKIKSSELGQDIATAAASGG